MFRRPRSEKSSGKAADGVTLVVTPELKVSESRLKSESLESRIKRLAHKSSRLGLVDAGAQSIDRKQTCLTDGHYNGFIHAVTVAFANHYPVALRPQHIWLLILQGVSKHVEMNAETVRKRWVSHEGKMELVCRRDQYVKGKANDWLSTIEGAPDSFATQIDANVVAGVAEALSPAFGGTTPVERICEKVTVMEATKSFFSFKCETLCGFPSVRMEGSAEDWALLRTSAATLIGERCEEGWARTWLASLLPLLDKLNEEYAKGGEKGAAGDEKFWNSMCKRGGTSGSGAQTWFNGWVNILFPYILSKPNQYCVPYSPSNGYVLEGRNGGQYGEGLDGVPEGVQGPDCADFPEGMAEAAVTWNYLGSEVPLKFQAGFVGAAQDAVSGTVRPCLGWFITLEAATQSVMDDVAFAEAAHDAEADSEKKLRAIEKVEETEAFLVKGMEKNKGRAEALIKEGQKARATHCLAQNAQFRRTLQGLAHERAYLLGSLSTMDETSATALASKIDEEDQRAKELATNAGRKHERAMCIKRKELFEKRLESLSQMAGGAEEDRLSQMAGGAEEDRLLAELEADQAKMNAVQINDEDGWLAALEAAEAQMNAERRAL